MQTAMLGETCCLDESDALVEKLMAPLGWHHCQCGAGCTTFVPPDSKDGLSVSCRRSKRRREYAAAQARLRRSASRQAQQVGRESEAEAAA